MLKIYLKSGNFLEVNVDETTFKKFRKWIKEGNEEVYEFNDKFDMRVDTVIRDSVEAYSCNSINVENIYYEHDEHSNIWSK